MADRIAGRVVAGRRQEDEERGDLVRLHHVLGGSVVDQLRHEVIGRIGSTLLDEFGHQLGELDSGSDQRRDRVTLVDELGVAAAEDDVRGVEHRAELAAWHAHHVADDHQWEWLRQHLDQVGLALFAEPVDHLGADLLDRVDHPRQFGRGERLGDDPALMGVARVVHVDEPGEVLEHLRRQIEDRRGAARRAEVVRMLADSDDLVEASDRIERLCGADQRVLDLDRQEGAELADLGELGHPILERLMPEEWVDDACGVSGHGCLRCRAGRGGVRNRMRTQPPIR